MRLGEVQFPKVYSWNMTDPGLNFRSAVLIHSCDDLLLSTYCVPSTVIVKTYIIL